MKQSSRNKIQTLHSMLNLMNREELDEKDKTSCIQMEINMEKYGTEVDLETILQYKGSLTPMKQPLVNWMSYSHP